LNGCSRAIFLGPEAYFFAGPATVYVADGGRCRRVGDGGLQKWSLTGGTWLEAAAPDAMIRGVLFAPEPGSAAVGVLTVGLAGIGVVRRRRAVITA
jgi:hypothetical protein